jgi:hypothetical protein
MAAPSLRKAINNKCKDCIYDPSATGCGSWLQQITDCTDKTCSLWKVRPTMRTKEKVDVV